MQCDRAVDVSDVARRDPWTAFSTYKMWQTMLGVTTRESRNHSILAETFSTILTSKFTQLLDDMQRVYKKVSLVLRDVQVVCSTLAVRMAEYLLAQCMF